MSFYYIDDIPNPKNTMMLNVTSHHYDGKTRNSYTSFNHHNHEVFEIICVIDGEISIRINDNIYHLHSGEIVIINPFKIHYGEWIPNNQSNTYLCLTTSFKRWLSFSNSVLAQELTNISDFTYGFVEHPDIKKTATKKLFNIVLHINDLFELKNAVSECRIASYVYKMFAVLFNNFYIKFDNTQHQKLNMDFIKKVSQYLNENYTYTISTSDIANALYMPLSGFCREFKKNFGVTFSNYLCKFRIMRATELYKFTKLPVSDIASSVGFSDYNYFSKMFKKYTGQSPARYFNKWQK